MHIKQRMYNLVFLCGARDFHAIDWYKSATKILTNCNIYIVTDLIAGEGYNVLINDKDKIYKLLIIDKLLFTKQSRIGNVWRNVIKLILFPFQVVLLKRFSKRFPKSIYHAHAMYYLFLAYAAGIPFIGTPQGSDILIKPYRSKLFRYFSVKSLKAAKAITVDSIHMKDKVYELTGISAHIIQNGIDYDAIKKVINAKSNIPQNRNIILSIRGFTPLYRIRDILEGRNLSIRSRNIPFTLIYPFYQDDYLNETKLLLQDGDKNLGRVDRNEMYKLLIKTLAVFSIPQSDSSPRSIYESIFCGCAVAITYNTYYEILPECMKQRIILVDLEDKGWFDSALERAKEITKTPFYPTDEAIEMFDQLKCFDKMAKLFFS